MLSAKKNILILRELSEAEWTEINHTENIAVYSTIHKDKPNIKYIELDPENQKQILQEIFDIMLSAGAKQQEQKEALNEALKIHEIAYWYYIRFTFYFQKYPPYVEEQNIIQIASSLNLSNITVYSNFSHSFDAKYYLPNKTKKTNTITWVISFLFIFLSRAFIGFLLNFKNKSNKNIILIEPYNQQKIIDIRNTNQIIRGDYYNEYLTDYTSTQHDFLFMSDYYIPKFGDKQDITKALFFNKYTRKSLYFEFYFLCHVLNPFNWRRAIRFRNNLRQRISLLQHNDFHKYIIPFIKSKINLLTLMNIREEVIKKWLKKNRVQSITCHHEQAYHHYSFVMAARQVNVTSIGFQHGIIHPLHPHYIFTPDDKKYKPFPDYMIAWGEHWKNFLVKKSIYSASDVICLGQIRTDIIEHLPKPESKNTLQVLYASQPHYRAEIRDRITHDIFDVMKKFPKIRLVIKPHPGEKDAQAYFSSKGQETGYHDWEITRSDLYVLLNESDLLLTYNSTVASEAIYFKKPVFLYDPENRDLSGYTPYLGAVFNNVNPQELYGNFDTFVKGGLPINEAVQDKFIEMFGYKIDGKTSFRYMEFIRNINKRTNDI